MRAIVGGTVGGLAGLTLLAGLFFTFRRRHSNSKDGGRGQTSMLQRPATLSSPTHEAITPFLQMDPGHLASHTEPSSEGSISQNRWLTAAENKRALGMRRAQQADEHRVTSGPTSVSSDRSRTTRSEPSNPSQTEVLLREITSLRREITAIRAPADNVSESAPPEYGDV